MTFSELSIYLQKIEQTSSRNFMVEVLAELFCKAEQGEIQPLCYLLQGRVAPLYEPLEFGMAEKMIVKAVALGVGVSGEEVMKMFKEEGDLGIVVEKVKSQKLKVKSTSQKSKLSVNEVFNILMMVAVSGGHGSVEVKTNLLADLFKGADPLSARYIARIPIAKMRLGFSDMTVLDALSWMLSGSKEHRPEIERAFNVRPDLGFIAKTVKDKGIKGLKGVTPKIGTPILMARAERLSSGEEIIKKIGTCAVEPKIDGFRLQAHFNRKGFVTRQTVNGKRQETFDFIPNNDGVQKVRLFTRNLEDVTFMYPDVVEGIEKQIKGEEVIFEGETIAFNPATGEYLPFQETVQRKRKYDIETMKKTVPLQMITFDLLYKGGENYLVKPYKERRKELEKTVGKGETVLVAEKTEISDGKVLEQLFQDSISRGLEGVVAKKLDGVYQAGARGWNWIKYKRSYDAKLDDTIDAVVMGYDFGQGKRTGFGIGAFLIGVYDKASDSFKTIAKIGTGLSDAEWRTLQVQSSKCKVQSCPLRYEVDKMMECDVWVDPKIVVVIKADEITRSPVHTAGREMQKTKAALRSAKGGTPGKVAMEVKTQGFALRFPRLVDFRDDKSAEDATSVEEIEEMYQLQSRK